MNERADQLAELFGELLDLPPSEQAERLRALHRQDAEFAHEIESLLLAHRAAPAYLESLDREAVVELLDDDDRNQKPERAGPWRLIRELGRGGLGVVYLAERAGDDFEQRVAVKLIKRGMDSDAIVRRFDTERRIMASLDHPNIARLIDGGVLDDGRPWFAMDYVDGQPITDWCEQRTLSIRERLRLFQQVTRAVQAAHANLIVHRDLKPSNILVNDDGQVKLLDFGIAKLLDPDLAQSMQLTRVGAVVMTPEYAAPEQIAGRPITVATDVYALGVVLYELLSGCHPYRDAADTRESLERAVRDSSPLLPSSQVARSDEGHARVERLRLASLRKKLRGDLDAIVLTAMARDPERRYSSMEALADDIQRHLEGLPVRARARSRAYRAGRFLRRHRVGVSALAAVMFALCAGLGVALWQAREARHQAMLAEQSREFVISLLTEIAPSTNVQGIEMPAVDLLLSAADRVEAADDLAPLIQGRLAGKISEVLLELGSMDRALALARLGVERLEGARQAADISLLAFNLYTLARIQVNLGQGDEAEETTRRGLALLDQMPEPSDDDRVTRIRLLEMRARRLGNQYDAQQAIALRAQALSERIALFGPDHVNTASGHNNLASALHTGGQFETAEFHYGEVGRIMEQIDPDHPRVANVQLGLGVTQIGQGRLADAEATLQTALETARRHYGEESGLVISCLAHLGHLRRHQGRYQDAYDLFGQVALSSDSSLNTLAKAVASSWQGSLALSLDRPDDAIDHYRRAAAILDELGHGAHAHAIVADIGGSLARLRSAGDLPDLQEIESLTSRLFEVGAGPTQMHAEGAELVAALLQDMDRPEDAERWRTRSRELFIDHFGPDHPRTRAAGTLYSRTTGAGRPRDETAIGELARG